MRRWHWIGAAIIAIAAALPLALLATNAAGPPDGKGRPAGPPASIRLGPDPLTIACDGIAASRLTVELLDARGRPVANGTTVFFDVQYGFASPVQAQTTRGEASTDVRLYPAAQQFPDDAEVVVHAGDLRASILIRCANGGGAPCNPFSPPQHPMSPPCPPPPDPCAPSPPAHPLSPPCPSEPSLPPISCTPAESADEPLYHLTLRAEEDAGIVTVYAGIEDLGGGPYQALAVQVCASPLLQFLGGQPTTTAPAGCSPISRDYWAISMSCEGDAAGLSSFGDLWVFKYACESQGPTHVAIGAGASVRQGDAPAPIQVSPSLIECSQPAGALPCPAMSESDPDPSYELFVEASESGGVVTASVGVIAVDEEPYQAVQWHVCAAELGLLQITPVDQAPPECSFSAWDGKRVLLGCLDLTGPNLDYSGPVFELLFSCQGDDAIQLLLETFNYDSFVADDPSFPHPPIAVRGSQLACSQAGPPTPTPTSTPTPDPCAPFLSPPCLTPALDPAVGSDATPTPTPRPERSARPGRP